MFDRVLHMHVQRVSRVKDKLTYNKKRNLTLVKNRVANNISKGSSQNFATNSKRV